MAWHPYKVSEGVCKDRHVYHNTSDSKVKLSKANVPQGCIGLSGNAAHILDTGIKCKSAVSFTLQNLSGQVPHPNWTSWSRNAALSLPDYEPQVFSP